MEPLYLNRTKLTYDLFKKGIVGNYKASHKILRVLSMAYAIILIFWAYVFSLDMNLTVCIPFFVFGFAIIFWNFFGFRLGTKKNFLKFAKLHQSHYFVEMEYRFFDEKIEQETTKTELTVFYNTISIIYEMDDILVIVFNKQVIIIDKMSFEAETELESLLGFLKSKNIKIKKY